MKPKSSSALYLLFAEGFCFLLISAAVIACGFVLNYQSDFDYEQVDEEHDYTQYWLGFVLFITAFVAIAAGTRQRSRWLVLSAMFLFFICILVSLFALVVEGNDWINYKNAIRRQEFWESEDYECTSPSSTSCACSNGNPSDLQMISSRVDCETLERVNYLYGGLVCCILAAIFFALSSLIIVIIFIPIRPFTVPVPKKRIKKITVMEEKPEPIVVYKPKKEPKPKMQEVVIRERRPPPTRVIVEPPPEPKTEVQEIVVRERRPRVQTIVYDEPRQQRPEVVYRLPRKRTLVYDEPRPQPPRIVPLEPDPEPKKEEVYDVGRFVPKVHPTPQEPGLEGFIVNPNFKKEETLPEPEEVDPHPMHFASREVDPPVRYIQQEPAPVRYIRHVRQPRIVYERPVVQHHAIVPVHKGQVVIHSTRPKPSYLIRREGERPLLAVRRRRANSDEGPALYRTREAIPERRRRVYVTQPPPRPQPQRTFVNGPQAPRAAWQRARSNSDEGPHLYRDRPSSAGRIYTDKEIAMARGEPSNNEGAKPTVFSDANFGTANLGHNRPNTAHIQEGRNEGYDRILEANLPSADKWTQRPGTPY